MKELFAILSMIIGVSSVIMFLYALIGDGLQCLDLVILDRQSEINGKLRSFILIMSSIIGIGFSIVLAGISTMY